MRAVDLTVCSGLWLLPGPARDLPFATFLASRSASFTASRSAPGCAPTINPTGNARLASAGTGDVLAGWIGGRWAACAAQGAADAAALALAVAVAAVWEHGHAAEGHAGREHAPLRAGDLVERLAAVG